MKEQQERSFASRESGQVVPTNALLQGTGLYVLNINIHILQRCLQLPKQLQIQSATSAGTTNTEIFIFAKAPDDSCKQAARRRF